MPLRLNDRSLASKYNALEAQRQQDPSLQVNDSNVLDLLAAVGDARGSSFAKTKSALSAPGISREQQVALIHKGLTDNEKADVIEILDRGAVPLSPSAFNFLNAVVGRDVVLPGAPLTLKGDLRNGVGGTVGPNASIEAVNLSAGQRAQDAMVIGQADDRGRFQAQVPGLQEGDYLQVRARYDDGSVGDWVTVHAHGTGGTDARNAMLSAPALKLAAADDGTVAFSPADGSVAISEPNARLQLINTSTGDKTVVTLDAEGRLPEGVKAAGAAGDTFSLSISDGVNNADFAQVATTLTVAAPRRDLPEPALHKKQLNADGTPKHETRTFTGPIFRDGMHPNDVRQGSLANCYFAAAASAVAHTDPEKLQSLIRDNGDGTVTCTFKVRDPSTWKFKDVAITVDTDLYVKPTGTPIYGRSTGEQTQAAMELWYPVLEKAFAQLHPRGYEGIGNGGSAGNAMEQLLGATATFQRIASTPPDDLWSTIEKAVSAGYPVCAGTHGESQAALYTNTGVYAYHAYTVLGTEEVDGERYVQLRNPWGYSEPKGDGVDDGVFRLKLADFTKLYSNLYVARG